MSTVYVLRARLVVVNSNIVRPIAKKKMQHWMAVKATLENLEGNSSMLKTSSWSGLISELADLARSRLPSVSSLILGWSIC